jgi:hypothetical protein
VAGESDPVLLADLARGRLRAKRDQLAQAVVGRFAPHHVFMITEQLSHLDYLDEAMERISTEIEQRLQDEWAAVELLDSVPGISQRAAEIVVAYVCRPNSQEMRHNNGIQHLADGSIASTQKGAHCVNLYTIFTLQRGVSHCLGWRRVLGSLVNYGHPTFKKCFRGAFDRSLGTIEDL